MAYKGHSKPDEQKILEGCRKGIAESQEALYHLYYSYVMGISLRYTRDRNQAQEILQDSFFKAFRAFETYKSSLPFKNWLRKIVVNTAIDYLRKYNYDHQTVDVTYLSEVVVDSRQLNQLDEWDLLKLIQVLPTSYRTVFNLFVVEGFSHKEISEKLGISIGTSKSHLAKARVKLQKLIVQLDPTKKTVNYG